MKIEKLIFFPSIRVLETSSHYHSNGEEDVYQLVAIPILKKEDNPIGSVNRYNLNWFGLYPIYLSVSSPGCSYIYLTGFLVVEPTITVDNHGQRFFNFLRLY